MKCGNCSHEVTLYENFCSACGTAVTGQSIENDITVELYKKLIGPNNQKYYLDRFSQFDKNLSTSFGWHWPAFFVTFYWFLYRKMWLNAFLYLVFPFIFGFFAGLIFAILGIDPSGVIWFIQLIVLIVIFIILPGQANALYYKHINKKIEKIQAQYRTPRQQLQAAEQQGGTSQIILILVMVLGFVFIIGILAAIAIPAYQSYVQKSQLVMFQEKLKQDQKITADYYQQNHIFPAGYQATVLKEPFPRIVTGVEFDQNGVILLHIQQNSRGMGQITYTPLIENGTVVGWKCNSVAVSKSVLPSNCRE